MPQALKVDWEPIRQDCLSGMTFQQLADKYGIHPDTIAKRSSRYAWKPAPAIARKAAQAAVKHIVKQHVQAAIASAGPAANEAVQAWVKQSQKTAAKLISRVSEQLDQPQSPEDLQRLAGALDRGDGVGRRSLGMDKVENALGGNRVLLSIAAVGVISPDGGLACLPVDYAQAEAAQPIDAEVISEGESFPVGDAQPSEPGQESFSEPTTPTPTG